MSPEKMILIYFAAAAAKLCEAPKYDGKALASAGVFLFINNSYLHNENDGRKLDDCKGT
jgi:hypothetical protein